MGEVGGPMGAEKPSVCNRYRARDLLVCVRHAYGSRRATRFQSVRIVLEMATIHSQSTVTWTGDIVCMFVVVYRAGVLAALSYVRLRCHAATTYPRSCTVQQLHDCKPAVLLRNRGLA